jgi:hypothetical protein
MDDQPIVRFVAQREKHLGDCTVAAFAMCVGVTYSEALVAIAAIAPRVLTEGATWGQLKQAATARGTTLVEKKAFDLDDVEEGSGILGVQFHDRVGDQHAVYFKRGLIFDGRTESVWDADVYLRVNKVTVLTMLVRTR